MSEVYWLGGVQDEQPTDSSRQDWVAGLATRLFAETGLRFNRLDEVHWMGEPHDEGDPAEALFQIECNGRCPSLFSWPNQPGLDHYLLHSLARAILVRDDDIVLLGGNSDGEAAALVLASPEAVGRYNLLPRARLLARFSTNVNSMDCAWVELERALRRGGFDPAEIAWLVTPDRIADCLPPDAGAFNQARRLGRQPSLPGAFAGLNALVQTLEVNLARLGLLVSAAEGRPLLATLVERI